MLVGDLLLLDCYCSTLDWFYSTATAPRSTATAPCWTALLDVGLDCCCSKLQPGSTALLLLEGWRATGFHRYCSLFLLVMLEFRAGKMLFEGKRVTPDTRKGLVRIARGEEGLVHFQWLDRVQNMIEDDQIIFPEEATFEKVEQASGRVYILKFSTDDRKFFFWMQEPKAEDDQQLCHSVNYHLNRPLDLLAEEDSRASIPVQAEEMVEDDISSRAGNLIGPSMGAEVVSDVTSAPGPVKLADLQRILSNLHSTGSAGDVEDPDGGFGLGDLLKPDLVLPLLEMLPFEERLASYLPEGQQSVHDLLEVLQCAPFRQQVDAFTYVLKTGQIDLAQFGIDPTKYNFTVLSFLEALEDSASKNIESDALGQSTNDPMDEGK